MKKALFVIANNGFQDTEFEVPKQILETAGVEITISASEKGRCIGKYGTETQANFPISEIKGNEYDVIVFVGGPGATSEYYKNADYLRIAKEAKIIAAICIAPTIISDSGLFERKKVTGWNDGNDKQKNHIENNGGIFTGEDITIDGNIITANGPNSAEEFGNQIVEQLSINK